MSCFSNPVEGGRISSSKIEQQARQAALGMTSSIIHSCCELLALGREKAEEIASSDILSNACVVTTLLPLVLAHVSPLATSDPRVSFIEKNAILTQMNLFY